MKQQLLPLDKEDERKIFDTKKLKIALLGNPNSGKSSLFNHLTGLNQSIGNFPGVTVDKKSGYFKYENTKAEVIDLPGTYSIYPRSLDERIVFDVLSNPEGDDYPDLAIVVVDVSNIRRNLLLFTQIRDLGIPVILAFNMVDLAQKVGVQFDIGKFARFFEVPVVAINARTGKGINDLKASINLALKQKFKVAYDVADLAPQIINEIKETFKIKNNYRAWLLVQQAEYSNHVADQDKRTIASIRQKYNFDDKDYQAKETIKRYKVINDLVWQSIVEKKAPPKDSITRKIDKIVTHKYWGYLIFVGILFLIFQAIFAWAAVPMDLIDLTFSNLAAWLEGVLPAGPLSSLVTEGIIPGMAGILIFIPQIALLFTFISLLEESGYMSRVVFLMDKIMRKFGLSGKSVVPLISGVACAIPAIMATRNIENWKDRIITIFVTPLMSCSARIPVYTILIALVVPQKYLLGFVNLQGLVLLALYALGFIAAILSAALFKLLVKARDRSYFIMELPTYKMPRWKNVGFTIYEKSKTFVLEAGKIILAISIILWVLASYGPSDEMAKAEEQVQAMITAGQVQPENFESKVESYKLEHSYAGHFGKFIEPVIKPLGYDWKIGIALITSFAAREVFVGTMATIYSIGADWEESDNTIKARLKNEINPETGEKMYTPALAFSLLVFYAFAMQCMSTLAVVKRETKSWKWPILQLIYLTALAYGSAYLVYNLMK
jgi:ferrous iron transport protein B